MFLQMRYLPAKIASLPTVSPKVQFCDGRCLALYSLRGLPLRLSALTEDTSMTTVSTCGVKLLPLAGKETLKHWTHTCTSVAFHSFIHSFIQTLQYFFFLFPLRA